MKLFQIFQNNIAEMGIIPNKRLFHRENLKSLLMGGLSSVLCFAYLIFDAKSFRDYTETIYMTSVMVVVTVDIAIYILNTKELYQLIYGSEKYINVCKKLENKIRNIKLLF